MARMLVSFWLFLSLLILPEAGARSAFADGGAARRAAVERSGTGEAGTAARLAGGHEVVGACE